MLSEVTRFFVELKQKLSSLSYCKDVILLKVFFRIFI